MSPVAGKARSDQQIKKDVVDCLVADGRVDASGVNVEVSSGKVILTGNVPSCATKCAARDDAFGVLGVRGVQNQLTVLRADDTPVLSDADIQANAGSVLEWCPDIDSSAVQVSVRGGAVYLRGAVVSYWRRALAEALVTNIDGVTDVQNELVVTPTDDVRDEDIAETIEASLRRSAAISAADVTVKVEKGVVTLMGIAPDHSALHGVLEAAQYATGVRDVRNCVSIAG